MAFRPLPLALAIPVSRSQTHWAWAVARLLALEAEAAAFPPPWAAPGEGLPGVSLRGRPPQREDLSATWDGLSRPDSSETPRSPVL